MSETAEERAEKTVAEWMGDGVPTKAIEVYLAEAIRQAERKAFIRGLREAARIADEHNDPEYVCEIVRSIEAEADRLEKENG